MTFKITASVLLLSCFAGPALSQSAPVRSVMLHGNYCGPGNNAALPPVDALDAACARHDACTPDGALASKACNLRLQQDAALVARDPRQPENLKVMAGFISAGAALMPFEAGPETKMAAIPISENPVRRPHASHRTIRDASFDRTAPRN